MSNFLQKGETVPLEIPQTPRQRILAGLRWDPLERDEIRTVLMQSQSDELTEDTLQSTNLIETYDLDLIALIFNANYELIDAVSPNPSEAVDRSGKIYHSGDDRSGVGGHDDEDIYIEFTDLPEDIYHIVFLATAQSGHTFGNVLNPEIRIAQSTDNIDLLRMTLGEGENADMTGVLFAHIFKDDKGWSLTNLSEYRIDSQVEDWAAEVIQLIKV